MCVYLHDYNSVANKAEEVEDQLLQFTEETKTNAKKTTQRKTRQLYKADFNEPYNFSPCKVSNSFQVFPLFFSLRTGEEWKEDHRLEMRNGKKIVG